MLCRPRVGFRYNTVFLALLLLFSETNTTISEVLIVYTGFFSREIENLRTIYYLVGREEGPYRSVMSSS
ncbi:hypothetical protein LY78DRAFT_305970 [Colletotrichum sublineola]|nr:hypothetical protein LY78DRAFT_305970 [Colletotrichum sublineola]